ncbi:hypothetical protein Tco_0680131 [Tanacetum coccineum]|uniref:Uncharacterized protein n=1 Tax=Tanacetum coccineum TaxID=301880 RepID=A0ABQ4XJS8_9ASTR
MMVGFVVDLGIHGLGLVIVAIGKKLVVVLIEREREREGEGEREDEAAREGRARERETREGAKKRGGKENLRLRPRGWRETSAEEIGRREARDGLVGRV